MAPIPEHIIERIRESVDIVEIISRFIPLKKAGQNFKTTCPFHTEKTPSFSVNPKKQIFHCFGCGVGGNVYSFLMQYEKISFVEAVKKLAQETGITLPEKEQSYRTENKYDQLFKANQIAMDFYHELLKKNYHQLEPYLQGRGISKKTITDFKLGFVPDQWDALFKHIQQSKFKEEPFREVGLILRSDKDPSREYDRFRNRLIFPIKNVSGRPIAFGGRFLGDDPRAPKYLNSPESPIYLKNQVLYGLDVSKEWIRQNESAIFVEGYMDFMQLWQHEIKNVVATSGTALTENHTGLIKRYTQKVIICYDSDTAGISAAIRGGQTLFQNDLEVYILALPEGEDPDSFVQKKGASAFHQAINKSPEYFDFLMQFHAAQLGNSSNAVSKIIQFLIDSLAEHRDALKQNIYLNKIAERYRIQPDLLNKRLRDKQQSINRRENQFSANRQQSEIKSETLVFRGDWKAEIGILVLLINYFKDLKELVLTFLTPEEFLNPDFRSIYEFIIQQRNMGDSNILHLVISEFQEMTALKKIEQELFEEISNPEKYFKDCVVKIKSANAQQKLEALKLKLKETPADSQEYLELLTAFSAQLAHKKNIPFIFDEK